MLIQYTLLPTVIDLDKRNRKIINKNNNIWISMKLQKYAHLIGFCDEVEFHRFPTV